MSETLLKVVSGGPFKPTLSEVVPAYEVANSIRIDSRYEPMGPLLERLAAGEHEDVLILSAEAMLIAQGRGWVDAAGIVEIGRVGVGVGVRQGARVPDVSTPEAFKAALLAARSVVATDPAKGTSGMHFAAVLAKLGITEQMRPKLRLVDGGYGADSVAAGEIEMVVQPMTVVKSAPGVAFAGPLPDSLQKTSRYEGAVTTSTRDAASAMAFLAHLQTPAVRAALVRQGFEP